MENKFTFAKEIVREAASYILKHMKDDLHIERKSSPTDLVTKLDKEVQALLIEKIRSRYPDDLFCAEEGELKAPVDQGCVWVIDPIDGTNNFVAQAEDFAIMVAYFENGQGQFGIIYDVMKDVCYYGGGVFPAYCNHELLPPFKAKPLSDFLVAINAGMLEKNTWGVADLGNASLGVRVYGSAAISFSKILSGQLLTYITYLQPWDYAAASILGENLGYQVITLSGEKPDFQTCQPVMMAPIEMLSDIQSYIYERKP
ncbi:inositol monophosphatase family protein [Streptococcus timonensis]|uniref:inositol monophosphatase family protein n=1 Tax=Streptococcus timonensis TaxID=1852387 RepID=UPI0039C145CA